MVRFTPFTIGADKTIRAGARARDVMARPFVVTAAHTGAIWSPGTGRTWFRAVCSRPTVSAGAFALVRAAGRVVLARAIRNTVGTVGTILAPFVTPKLIINAKKKNFSVKCH